MPNFQTDNSYTFNRHFMADTVMMVVTKGNSGMEVGVFRGMTVGYIAF